MGRLTSIVPLLRFLGPRWAVFRTVYFLRKKSGALVRNSPAGSWADLAISQVAVKETLLFKDFPIPGSACMAEADAILEGVFRLYSFHRVEAEIQPDWHRNPLTGERAPAGVHWSRVGDFAHGDIKAIWELSRFPWAFSLARAYARTRDGRYAEAFWSLFDDWIARNPPNCGPGWMCGQEAAFRLMAAAFARSVCAEAAAATVSRLTRFNLFVLVTGRRIEANLDYALSQSNNHGISECIGLITAAWLLPGVSEARRWHDLGLSRLKCELDELVYPDGAFAQHSANYHRVLLHDLLWCIVVLRAGGAGVPPWLTGSARRALDFIEVLMTSSTGRVPLYGANDGANILPLADCDYLDFRPLVQSGFAVLEGRRRLPPGPWDEAALWLAGSEGLQGSACIEVNEGRRHLIDGGCFQWVEGEMRLFLRCPTHFRHRPSQADLLHVNLEWRDQPIAIDAGSYSYNATGAFSGALGDAAVHSTLTIDGAEPMAKVGRFLYLPWPNGRARWKEYENCFEAEHSGWDRIKAAHIRRVCIQQGGVVSVEDAVRGKGRHTARVHWLLADWPYELLEKESRLVLGTPLGRLAVSWTVTSAARVALVRADLESARGWYSPHYLQAAPALSLSIEVDFEGEARVETRFAPMPAG